MKLTLSIHQPCDELWENMIPVPGGRNCESCAKIVVDLSNCTDAELLRFFSEKSSSGTCCRLRDDQMNRTLHEPRVRNFGVRVWQKAAALLMAVQVMAGNSDAQRSRLPHQTAKAPVRNKAAKQPVLRGQITGMDSLWTFGSLTFQFGDASPVEVTPDSGGKFKLSIPIGFQDGTLRWNLKDAGEGLILDDSIQVDAALRSTGLEIEWLKPNMLPKAVLKIESRARVSGGLVVPQREAPIRRKSFFQRVFGSRTKS